MKYGNGKRAEGAIPPRHECRGPPRKLMDVARQTIAEHETLVLSDRDREAFFEALINPPEPSERLKQAMLEIRDFKGAICPLH
jgi:hypothetical protein